MVCKEKVDGLSSPNTYLPCCSIFLTPSTRYDFPTIGIRISLQQVSNTVEYSGPTSPCSLSIILIPWPIFDSFWLAHLTFTPQIVMQTYTGKCVFSIWTCRYDICFTITLNCYILPPKPTLVQFFISSKRINDSHKCHYAIRFFLTTSWEF